MHFRLLYRKPKRRGRLSRAHSRTRVRGAGDDVFFMASNAVNVRHRVSSLRCVAHVLDFTYFKHIAVAETEKERKNVASESNACKTVAT